MIKAQRLGHATIETPDLQKSLDYFVSLNGFVIAHQDKTSAHLATKIGQLTLTLLQSDKADCTRLSFEVAPDSDFQQMSRFLASEGISSEIRKDPFPGTPEVLTFTDCKGTAIDLFRSWSFISGNQNVAGIGPLKMGHIAFFTPDVQATVNYYEKILGFRVSDWLGDFFVFMRCNPDHHTVNFFRGTRPKLHHLAFELKDFAHMQQSCETLAMSRIPLGWGPMRHGPGHNLATYHRNPDDHVVEYYCELDQMKNEELGYFEPRPWHVDRPQRPKVWEPHVWASGWGTPPAPSHMRQNA
jgi:catechol 2,3-dioxygenase-like lactoylglutathione lyase family enzyme